MLKDLPFRVWLLIVVLVLAMIAINPSPGATGVQVKSVVSGSVADKEGIGAGEIIQSINGKDIETLRDYAESINEVVIPEVSVSLVASGSEINYITTKDVGFLVDDNMTIISVEDYAVGLERDMIIESFNGVEVSSVEELNTEINGLIVKNKWNIVTNEESYIFLQAGELGLSVAERESSNIKKGLDLAGGSRVLIQPVGENVDDQTIQDLISVMDNRLNVYGLSDLRIRPAKDNEGNNFVLVELAGATREEVKELIGKQGVFEAKIADDVVFEGGEKDITFVCRGDGSCSGIRNCGQISSDQWSCRFEFAIHLSEEAAQRHADITKDLDVNISETGQEYLSQKLDFYLDEKKVDSLNIGADLKGKETTSIAISGPGFGTNRAEAAQDAFANMDKLQTILITGSLPVDLEIVKLDTISPVLGEEFLKNSVIVGLVAILAVGLVVFIRYRKLKIVIPMILTSASEIVILLGFAALLQWNLDIAAIAGIIAAVGTGVDHLIIVTDEVIRGENVSFNWKEKVKRAFSIIFVAYMTTVAAMIPLWNAGAGLIRGFAFTTIAGITIGVFITRPAFAAIVERLLKD